MSLSLLHVKLEGGSDAHYAGKSANPQRMIDRYSDSLSQIGFFFHFLLSVIPPQVKSSFLLPMLPPPQPPPPLLISVSDYLLHLVVVELPVSFALWLQIAEMCSH